MANKKFSERQLAKINSERETHVCKRDDMIQKSRHKLSVREQKCILYAISKIKPDDSVFQEYTFDIKDFFNICGFEGDSYTALKATLLGLKSKSWWIKLDKGVLSAVSWFSTLRIHEKSGKVTIEFHKDMMPYLLELVKQGKFYTHYELKYVLPMGSQYSIRLYEIIKSYHKNNSEWFFEIDELKELLDCEKYLNFCDFRRFVLEPAVKEINIYTDVNLEWDTEKEGRKVTRVKFYMTKKRISELYLETYKAIRDKLDGSNTIKNSSI